MYVPVMSVPMKLPCTVKPSALLTMPVIRLLKITLRAPAAVPPIKKRARAGRNIHEINAAHAIGYRRGAVGAEADDVALNDEAARPTGDKYAVVVCAAIAAIARDDVARPVPGVGVRPPMVMSAEAEPIT